MLGLAIAALLALLLVAAGPVAGQEVPAERGAGALPSSAAVSGVIPGGANRRQRKDPPQARDLGAAAHARPSRAGLRHALHSPAEILLDFKSRITNWEEVQAARGIQGWKPCTPADCSTVCTCERAGCAALGIAAPGPAPLHAGMEASGMLAWRRVLTWSSMPAWACTHVACAAPLDLKHDPAPAGTGVRCDDSDGVYKL